MQTLNTYINEKLQISRHKQLYYPYEFEQSFDEVYNLINSVLNNTVKTFITSEEIFGDVKIPYESQTDKGVFTSLTAFELNQGKYICVVFKKSNHLKENVTRRDLTVFDGFKDGKIVKEIMDYLAKQNIVL
jgi:hypothetical protein